MKNKKRKNYTKAFCAGSSSSIKRFGRYDFDEHLTRRMALNTFFDKISNKNPYKN
jgi:hypothetical protein